MPSGSSPVRARGGSRGRVWLAPPRPRRIIVGAGAASSRSGQPGFVPPEGGRFLGQVVIMAVQPGGVVAGGLGGPPRPVLGRGLERAGGAGRGEDAGGERAGRLDRGGGGVKNGHR